MAWRSNFRQKEHLSFFLIHDMLCTTGCPSPLNWCVPVGNKTQPLGITQAVFACICCRLDTICQQMRAYANEKTNERKGGRSFITFLVMFWPLRFVTCRLKSVRQVAVLILRRCLSGASNDNCDTFYHCIAFSPPRKWKFFFSLLLTFSPFPAYNNYARHHQSLGAMFGFKLLPAA